MSGIGDVRESSRGVRLDTGYFRADVEGTTATFWKVLGAKSSPTIYLIRDGEIDELIVMLHAVRARFRPQEIRPPTGRPVERTPAKKRHPIVAWWYRMIRRLGFSGAGE